MGRLLRPASLPFQATTRRHPGGPPHALLVLRRLSLHPRPVSYVPLIFFACASQAPARTLFGRRMVACPRLTPRSWTSSTRRRTARCDRDHNFPNRIQKYKHAQRFGRRPLWLQLQLVPEGATAGRRWPQQLAPATVLNYTVPYALSCLVSVFTLAPRLPTNHSLIVDAHPCCLPPLF